MTLLELLVVIMLLAIVAALFPLAIQRMMPARRLAAAARHLTVDLRELQSQAAVSGRPLALVLEPSGYMVQEMLENSTRHVTWPEKTTATLKAAADAQPSRELVMYPDGSSSGGEIELRLGERLATVSVTATTGRVRVSR